MNEAGVSKLNEKPEASTEKEGEGEEYEDYLQSIGMD